MNSKQQYKDYTINLKKELANCKQQNEQLSDKVAKLERRNNINNKVSEFGNNRTNKRIKAIILLTIVSICFGILIGYLIF